MLQGDVLSNLSNQSICQYCEKQKKSKKITEIRSEVYKIEIFQETQILSIVEQFKANCFFTKKRTARSSPSKFNDPIVEAEAVEPVVPSLPPPFLLKVMNERITRAPSRGAIAKTSSHLVLFYDLLRCFFFFLFFQFLLALMILSCLFSVSFVRFIVLGTHPDIETLSKF